MRKCSMHTSHPHGAMVLQYLVYTAVYARYTAVYSQYTAVYHQSAAGTKGEGSYFAFQMHMSMQIFQGGSIGPPFNWYNAVPHKDCRGIAICRIVLLYPPFGEVCVESSGVLHSPTQGALMRLRVYGGGVVDAKAYKQARRAEILLLPACPCSPKLHIVHLYTQKVRSTHHRRQRNPARSGGKSHSGTSARSGEGLTTAHTNHTHTHTGSKPQPAPATHAHTHTHTPTHTEDTPTPTPPRTHDTHTNTDTTRARTEPQTQTPAANHNQGRWGHAHKQHDPEKQKAPPTTTTPPGRDGKPTTANHTERRGA